MSEYYIKFPDVLRMAGDFDPMKHVAIIHPFERRAIALNQAIASAGKHFDFSTGAEKLSQGDQMRVMTDLLIQRAKQFEAFIVGEE